MRHIFLDLDNTVTESRQKISPQVKKALEKLQVRLYVISGASKEQMEYQLDGLLCTILAQSGNDTPLWKNELTGKEYFECERHFLQFLSLGTQDVIENRGSQIAVSLVGHNRNSKIKKIFDPKQIIRQAILKQHPFKSKTLTCRIAGTTCFDYTHKNGTKGKNIACWIKEKKLNKKDCIYYGDALFKGGNDESVKGVIKTISVKNPEDLLKKI